MPSSSKGIQKMHAGKEKSWTLRVTISSPLIKAIAAICLSASDEDLGPA
jgi:hypothetical protein